MTIKKYYLAKMTQNRNKISTIRTKISSVDHGHTILANLSSGVIYTGIDFKNQAPDFFKS